MGEATEEDEHTVVYSPRGWTRSPSWAILSPTGGPRVGCELPVQWTAPWGITMRGGKEDKVVRAPPVPAGVHAATCHLTTRWSTCPDGRDASVHATDGEDRSWTYRVGVDI